MMGRRFGGVIAVALCVACAGGASPAEAPGSVPRKPETPANHRDAAVRLFEQLDMEKVMESSIDATLDAQLEGAPQLAPLEDVIRDFLARHMSWEALEGDFVRIYTKAFTQREIEDLLAFYETPTGKKTVVLLPELMKQGAEVGQRRVREHLPELQAMLKKRADELQMQQGGDPGEAR